MADNCTCRACLTWPVATRAPRAMATTSTSSTSTSTPTRSTTISPRPAFLAYQTAVRYLSQPTSAVYTWDGASEPPTEDQITQLIQSNAQRVQWVWPAAVNRVTLERGPERVSVVWNASPSPATAH